jgi:hypothetical membrane protein
MLAFILFLVIAAIVLGIVGVVVKGLLYLLFIGIVVFLVGLLIGALGTRRRRSGRAGLSLPLFLMSAPWAGLSQVRPAGRLPG